MQYVRAISKQSWADWIDIGFWWWIQFRCFIWVTRLSLIILSKAVWLEYINEKPSRTWINIVLCNTRYEQIGFFFFNFKTIRRYSFVTKLWLARIEIYYQSTINSINDLMLENFCPHFLLVNEIERTNHKVTFSFRSLSKVHRYVSHLFRSNYWNCFFFFSSIMLARVRHNRIK